ncbi:hypothetical protein ACFT9I_27165 [Streptomyces sp. NPDC057137]|uniref:hypothetical protein n=1 Tax=Streptomyces sp. NPDC057137 TaxID=3346030 RepID=UPI00362ACC0D
MTDIEKMVAQLDELILRAEEVTQHNNWREELVWLRRGKVVCGRLESAIDRIAPPGSVYKKRVSNIYGRGLLDGIYDIAVALRDDLKDGWIDSVVEIVHADMHGDYLEMADTLISAGYKDPAAIITGTSLEVHVRALCAKHGVDTELSNGAPKKADAMNADLKKAGVYDGLQQKQITAWMDLRNKAAHGNYTDYDKHQVGLFIEGVRAFMIKYPA